MRDVPVGPDWQGACGPSLAGESSSFRLFTEGDDLYHPARKLHAKTALIDDEWCVVGSPNLDHLSLFVNHELALVARDRGLADALRDQYFVDLDDASEVQPSVWANRAWTERGVEAIGWAARKFL